MNQFKEIARLFCYDFKYYCRKVNRKLRRRLHMPDQVITSLYGVDFADLQTVQNRIYDLILNGQPFMVGRIGGIECLNTIEAIKVNAGKKKHMSKTVMKKAEINAGFFPPDEESIKKFTKMMMEAMERVDVLGSMPTNNEEYLIKKHLPSKAMVTEIGNLEPYYSSVPWSRALKGKRVLVIHPFRDSIIKQYAKRELLFSQKEILPEFDLRVIKAVQSIAGTKTEFDTWFSALDYMYDEAMKEDFDIAIIGCGAYGFPLAAKIKNAGKQAIHLGGATQILFGIWGSRWDNVEAIRKLKNENWVRPSIDETPESAKKVENACYW